MQSINQDLAWPGRDGQFMVSPLEMPPAAGAVRYALASIAVDVHGDLPVAPVVDGTGRRVGLVLGTVIDLDAGVIARAVTLESMLDAASIDDAVERHIYRLAGSFIFILDIPACRRIYLDADGSKSLVYEPAARRAGSTAMTLLNRQDYLQRLQQDRYRALGIDGSGWFTAGLTAHAGISRLLCNHYLDLDTWTAHRHWPRQPIAPSHDPAAAFNDLVGRVQATIAALAGDRDVSVALTAGLDSRFLLAASRPFVDQVSFVTVAAPAGALDVAVGRDLANRYGLRHEVLPYRRATAEQAQAWQIRAGHCISGVNMTMHPSVAPLRERYFVGGLGGEVGRGFLWLKADAGTPIDAAGIVARLKLPRDRQVVAAVDGWLRPLADFDTLQILDLAYLELRMSSWAFADAYANPVRRELHPMISRANFEAMLSVPADLRRTGAIFRDAISRASPGLLAVPVNRYGDWRDLRKRTLDVVTKPGRVVRKVKQLALALPRPG
jgi:hypothetical protein